MRQPISSPRGPEHKQRLGRTPKALALAQCAYVAAVFLATGAAAKGVFLNGVSIDGVTNQTFENATVQIDAQGNVLILAKGYEVQTVAPPGATTQTPAPGTANAPPLVRPSWTGASGAPTVARAETRVDAQARAVTQRYFLVSESSPAGLAQYDVDVFINSVWIKRISASDAQAVLEISRHLRQGKNTVHFSAQKNLSEGRKSASPAHQLTLYVGEGNTGGNNVLMENPLLQYTRTAAELQPFADDYVIVAR